MPLHLAEFLLKHYFTSKKAMAAELGVSYTMLRRVFQGKGSQNDEEQLMSSMALYCMKERIPPVLLFREYSYPI